jgi:phenylacetic acid degradation operon negative regulatory protein
VNGLAAKTMVLDFLSNRSPREMSAQVLVAAGEVLGFSAQNIRMALARLVERSAAVKTGRGRYRLSTSGEAMRLEARKWKHAAEMTRPWPGTWIGVHDAMVPRSDRTALRRHERAMRLRGFRELSAGLWIRPANLSDSIGELRGHLRSLGLHPDALVFGLRDLDERADAKAATLWDTASLTASYRALAGGLRASKRRLHRMSLEAAAAETLVLGRNVIRHINLDPLLPEDLMDQRPLKALIRAMGDYDEIGKNIWRQFMRWLEQHA